MSDKERYSPRSDESPHSPEKGAALAQRGERNASDEDTRVKEQQGMRQAFFPDVQIEGNCQQERRYGPDGGGDGGEEKERHATYCYADEA